MLTLRFEVGSLQEAGGVLESSLLRLPVFQDSRRLGSIHGVI